MKDKTLAELKKIRDTAFRDYMYSYDTYDNEIELAEAYSVAKNNYDKAKENLK